jgi:hypothetical protein
VSKRPPAQAVKKIIPAARAVGGGIQHLASNGIDAPRFVQPLSGAICALAVLFRLWVGLPGPPVPSS